MLLTDDATDCAIFVAKTEKSAVVHTACSKTAAGKQRLNDYMKILRDTLLNEMEIFDSHTPFKFGDGRKVYAERRARTRLSEAVRPVGPWPDQNFRHSVKKTTPCLKNNKHYCFN